jgi:glycosyltransferase involved in cell wall biosynthesis
VKILHTIYDDVENPWCGGGGALRTLQIARHLSQRHEITLLVGAFPGSERTKEIDGVKIIRVGTDCSYALSRLSFAALASLEVARNNFDLWVYSFSAYAPLKVSRKIRKKSLLEFFHLMGQNASEKFPIIGRLAQRAENEVLRLHPEILTISPTLKNRLQSITPNANVHLVYTGVNNNCFQSQGKEQDYILYFGRLDIHTKGLDILFEAMKKLSAKNIRLVLAGKGTPEREHTLRKMATSFGILQQIEFFGAASEEERNRLMSEALFVCMPSRYEGWGIVAIEAGAAKTAVIGTNIAGLRDAIRHNETGLLVKTEDPDSLAIAMKQLLENPSKRQEMGQNGYRWANRFTWEGIAKNQETVYKSICESRSH